MAYTFIEGSHKHMSGANGAITRIVIHCTVSPCENGGAVNTAHYFQSDNAGGLAHFVVDPSTVVQCCKEDTACWHAPPNAGSIGVELCDPQKGDPSRWADAPHEAMLKRAAALVADLAHRHGVPLTFLSVADLKAGKHGVTGHVEVSQAFGQSTHTDPGAGFPWDHFMALVKAASAPAPAPKPAPAPAAPAWFHRTLKAQSPTLTGDDVRHVQGKVGAHVDGAYGPETAKAVEAWQHSHGLTADGIVGPDTAKKMG